ncbi:tetratricopeptide repeat protein [Rhodocaloribacter litoris]|uniref:tetratricopeptide repeat protein n=1 Tax=Rhodocaloribacter litoris TaxID=2558931 RepID=UPI001422771C|nr:tetratricopeptide repeat protein [Rhodocaloribacter litoris]QXD15491.1 tetratricopeptide repeat protein [Rhodocaloribacter litoris]GIV60993.1 MAG: hypothetical protein KatS3mg043_2082 [Rhodothermaceae bacterium]
MPQDRLEALLRFYEEDPNDAFTRYALAGEYLKRGDTDRALSFFEGLVADEPDYLGTYYHLGKLYEHLGRPSDALATYRRGIERARAQGAWHTLSELQSALLEAEGLGSDDAS